MRRTTAKRMAEAKREIPHFYASSDVAMDECAHLKEGLGELEGEYTGLTYTHLVLKAVGVALRRVPEMNASLDDESVVLHDTVHVGLATATDQGLVVPVVRDCDRQPLGALVAQVRGLVERARAGKFAADDLRGGTFTVSNLGMYPVSHFAAVVNPPQAAILAVGTVRAVPVVRDGEVVPGHVMTVTLSCDHRIVDGALAGRFLRELVRLLEAPLALVA
jgi:pyruvate dehydrogenase E2 component (dihydrolipoamide acetyltransferase)